MFTRKVSCAAVAIAIGLLFSPVLSQTQDGPNLDDSKIRIVKRDYTDINEKQKWEVKIGYPVLRLKGGTISDGFNAAAKNLAIKQASEFKKQMAGFTKEDREFLPKNVNYYMEVGYSIEHIDDEFVSVNFVRSEYTGGAHPNHWSFTLNYDLKNDRTLQLQDLFKTNSDFLKVISSNSIRQIVKKQGEYAAPGWVTRGAGEKLENFKSWNITKKGLKFTFDPYQVGSYAEGFYETLVPYQKFKSDSQSSVFYNVVEVSYVDGNPPNTCRNGFFPRENVKFMLGKILGKKNSRAYFHSDHDDCPDGKNCREKAYVISGDRLIVSRKYGDYVCSWYQPRRGSETVGWIRASKINLYSPVKKPLFNKWFGTWKSDGNSLVIKRDPKRGFLKINGDAFWRGIGDNIHIGEVDDRGVPEGNTLRLGGPDKYDCRVKMQLVNDALVVSDNLNCGGVNVSFSGVYWKTR